MSIIIDLIILAIILLCVFFGYKHGLTKCIIKILSFVIAILVAAVFYKPVANFVISNTEFDDNIKNAIVTAIGNDVEETGKVKDDTNLPQTMVNYINDSIEKSVNETKTAAVNTIADNISKGVINICAAIALFIIVRIALIFVKAISSMITDLPIIKQVDKIGGVAYGLVEALLIIYVVLAIVSFISPMLEQSGVVNAINKSIVGSALYNNNLLLKIVF